MSSPVQEDATLIKQPLQPVEVKQDKIKQNKSDLSQQMHQSIIRSHSQDSLKNKVDLADSIVHDQPLSHEHHNADETEQLVLMPEDFFYQEKHQEKVYDDGPIPKCVTSMDSFFGYDSFKRYNPKILDRDNIIYSSGISYTIFNHFTKQQRRFFSQQKGGIGCIAVSHSKKHIAIGQMGQFPNIYIYEYPSLKLYRILRKGTQRTYSSICFSNDNNLLVTVGGDPDYLITVWEWKHERLMLKSKAFSQDIYRVSFSQFNQNLLTTSGTGHIRFWKIAETFTGLKLQGDIAKFGQFELSDVMSYAEFQDGNVLSSSQYGKLLLWQGNLIKSVVSIDQNSPCHRGSIQYVRLMGKQIVTAGSDGYIRFWDYEQINNGESDEQFNLFVKPKREVYFQSSSKGTPAYINWIEVGSQFWLVQDALGSLYKFYLNEDKRQEILKFNSGKFTDMVLSPLNNCCITTGNDGRVRLWDYGNKRIFYHRKFATQAESTCVEWLPFSKRNSGRMVAVGFADGIIRFLGLQQSDFKLVKAFKVHKNPIFKVKVNRQGSIVAVCDNQGSIFFLHIDTIVLDKIKPYCLFQTGFKVNDICFDKLGQKLLLACNDGRLHQLQVPKQSQCDYSQTFLRQPKLRSFTIKMMDSQKPRKQDLQLELLLKKTKGGNVDDVIVQQEWQPSPILNACYYDSQCTKILCSVDGKYLGNYYIVDMGKERPIGAIDGTKMYKTSYMHYNENSDMIFVGYRNGSWEIRHKYDPNMFMKRQSFDHNYGIVRKVAMNIENTAIVVVSQDGTMISYKIDHGSFLKGSRGNSIQPVQVNLPPVILGISDATFSDKIQFTTEQSSSVDIADSSIYSLQDEKLKAEQDLKLTQADKIKLKKKKKVLQLQKLYKEVIEANDNQTDYLAKLSASQLVIDAEYEQMLRQKVQEEVQETKKVMLWDEYRAELSKKKLQKYFLEELQFNSFNVKGIKTPAVVSSFKLQKISPYVQQELQQIQQILSQQRASQRRNTKNDKTVSQFQQSKAFMQINAKKDVTAKKGGKQQNFEVRNKIRQAEAQFQKQLEYAQSTMGDYKLKSSSDYTVPQNERLNVSRKKKHLFLNYQYFFLEKQEFNTRLDRLRTKKKEMVFKLDGVNDRLREINKELELEEKDVMFTIDEDIELLETEFDITQEDIAEHILSKQKEKEAAKKSGGMGMGSGNDGKEQKQDQIVKKPRRKKTVEKKQDKTLANLISVPARKNMKVKKSSLQDQFRQIKRIQLQAQKSRIHKLLKRQIQEFDQQLNQLRIYKFQLQNDLSMVQMKLLTYLQQFLIFRDMQTYDNQLMTSIRNFSSQKQSLQTSFINFSQQINDIETINEELKKKFEDEKKILKEFVYPQDDQMREKIIRYYKIRERKRIQKLKKQQEMEERENQSEDEDAEDDDNDSEDQEDSDEQEFEDDDDEKPDINVIENDHKNFQRVRKICEYDQKIEENQRRKSDLQKQRNQISNKIKTIDNELLKSERQLKIYQKKKLLKINQLFVSLPIKTSQIQYVVNVNGKARMQQDFSNAILFERQAFFKLGDRIQELKKQKIDIQKKQKNLNKKLGKLSEEVTRASSEIESKRKDYEEKQLLKFGSTFELEKLKELQPTDQVVDMRGLYKKEEKQVSNRIEQIKQQLQEKKRELLEAKRQNTRVITDITELGNKQTDLKKTLDSTNKQLFKNYDVSKKDQLQKERQNLKDLIKFLSKQIEDLKTQIGLFKRKGGHIYTMVTSNKKNFS